MNAAERVRRWLDASLRNRTAFTMIGISMAATTLLAAASFVASQRLVAENWRQAQQASLASFERQFDFESRALILMLEAMARNAFISNALVDSLGRDQYLLPFLRDQAFPGGWSGSLWLVDFKGRPIAGNSASTNFPYEKSEALLSALGTGRQRVEIDRGASHLMIAVPVVFPPTKSVEGAVVAVVQLASAVDHSGALVASDNCFRLVLAGGGIVVPPDCPLTGSDPVLTKELSLAGALAQLAPTLELYAPTGPRSSILGGQVLAYLAVIGAVFVAVLWASRRTSARITGPLLAVTDTANTIVRDGRLDLRVSATGSDEVSQLARSFNHMVESLQSAQARMRSDVERIQRAEGKLQALNAELERRVAERTADLEVTIVDLDRAREAAEKANRAKSEFLSRMSHELRTPLNAILGFTQIMQLRGSELGADERDQYVGQIEKAGWHLLELIKDLLDLSRIEAGTLVISREPVPLQAVCGECMELLRPLAQAFSITATDRTGDVEPLFALADRTRLSQVLMNLLSNAVKYNRPGGSVTLSLRADGDAVEIGVADTGRGFTSDQLRDLYQPFNRLGADRGAIDGTGIGLVISRRLIEMMGGQLSLATQENAGSQFTLRLPRADPAGIAPGECAARSTPDSVLEGAKRTILYIEDNPSNVELIRSALLLRPNVRVVAANDGPSGLALADAERPDLILIDIALPGMDGLEVCRRLRSRQAMMSTPIVAISANAMPADIQHGRAAGFDAYLTKPLDVKLLLSHVDRMLEFVAH